MKGSGTMRGIEAAMLVWSRVSRGGTVSEDVRVLDDVSPADRTLAASLCWAAARRLSLWEHLRAKFMKPKPEKFSKSAQAAVLMGAAGLTELRTFAPAVLISSLIDWTKTRDVRGSRVLNAVLRRILEEGPAEIDRLRKAKDLASQCLINGFPLWVAGRLLVQFDEKEGRRLIEMSSGNASLSLRLSPSVSAKKILENLRGASLSVDESPLGESLRINGTALPTSLPGYKEGFITPQSESSIAVGRAAADFSGSFFLDMCAGRGVKTGQILQLRPDIAAQAWDLSKGRVAAGLREMERLNLSDRVTFRQGNALELEPSREPDAILVDAPCSGSGTWRRHPEGKWRLSPQGLDELSRLQCDLLARAFSLVKPGGKVFYSTCSLLAEENELVAERALASFPEMRENDLKINGGRRSVGRLIMPENEWTDGFYVAAFTRGKSS